MTLTIEDFLKCCGSRKWAEAMAASGTPTLTKADEVFDTLEPSDWLEAFQTHPRIGERQATGWAAQEQSGVKASSRSTLNALAAWNARYFEKFGYIFIICATGKTAEAMLASLQSRLHNSPDEELRIAAVEQRQITHLRLERLLT